MESGLKTTLASAIGYSTDLKAKSTVEAIVPSKDSSGNDVASIGYNAFRSCSRLASVAIQDGVKSVVYGAFRNCGGLVSIVVPDSVTSISSYAFYDCNGLESVMVTCSVESIGEGAFGCCYSLCKVVFKGKTVAKVETMV